jgi:hypothetical protein
MSRDSVTHPNEHRQAELRLEESAYQQIGMPDHQDIQGRNSTVRRRKRPNPTLETVRGATEEHCPRVLCLDTRLSSCKCNAGAESAECAEQAQMSGNFVNTDEGWCGLGSNAEALGQYVPVYWRLLDDGIVGEKTSSGVVRHSERQ